MKKLACSWLALVCLALSLATGCGEVESCREATTPGCINTAPRADGTCLFDLVLRNGKCVKSGSDDDKCGLCADGALCVPEQNMCVDFCAVPTTLPGQGLNPEEIDCEAVLQPGQTGNPMLSFADTCTRRCKLRCQRLAQFCPGYQCPTGSCDQPEVQTKCASDCPPPAAGGMDLACLAKSCNDARFTRCGSSIVCPDSFTLACNSLTCSNDCAYQLNSQAVVGDGVCDDGDPLTSASNFCAWGTDCADCGPRNGTSAPAAGPLGALCQYNSNCAGATGMPSTATSWCIGLSNKVERCMPDCSRDGDCAKGFECRQVSFKDPTTQVTAPVTEGKLTSSACIPTACP